MQNLHLLEGGDISPTTGVSGLVFINITDCLGQRIYLERTDGIWEHLFCDKDDGVWYVVNDYGKHIL